MMSDERENKKSSFKLRSPRTFLSLPPETLQSSSGSLSFLKPYRGGIANIAEYVCAVRYKIRNDRRTWERDTSQEGGS